MEKSKIRVRLRAFDSKLIDASATSIVNSVKRTGAYINGPVPLPTKIRKYTVLRSPFVNKKSREQFEMRSHKRLIDILEPSKDTIEALEKLELPAGVEVEVKLG
ncbi:MAG: 30S ribosomal protein S10 [Spirochaetes bacterium]|nr:30S ribosomal protein S10 [Spirochaetota bacterium]